MTMNDDISIRAWYKAEKVMLTVSEIDFRRKRIKAMKDKIYSLRFDEVELMPKICVNSNGINVYDEDIIIASYGERIWGEYEYTDTFTVHYNDLISIALLCDAVNYEVIGNSYEGVKRCGQ